MKLDMTSKDLIEASSGLMPILANKVGGRYIGVVSKIRGRENSPFIATHEKSYSDEGVVYRSLSSPVIFTINDYGKVKTGIISFNGAMKVILINEFYLAEMIMDGKDPDAIANIISCDILNPSGTITYEASDLVEVITGP